MTEMQKRLLAKNGMTKEAYRRLVKQKIRAVYSAEDEFGIQRERDEEPEQFAAYNAFVKKCKAEAKAEMGM